MSDKPQEDRRIIVDEDWKSRVEAEREAQKNAEASGTQPAAGAEGADTDELPPASLPFLVTTLATQAMAALGQIPDPVEQKPVIRLQLAKHHIDTLAMLQEKTKGNLAPEEVSMLEEVLHQLRMFFVHVQSQSGASPAPDG